MRTSRPEQGVEPGDECRGAEVPDRESSRSHQDHERATKRTKSSPRRPVPPSRLRRSAAAARHSEASSASRSTAARWSAAASQAPSGFTHADAVRTHAHPVGQASIADRRTQTPAPARAAKATSANRPEAYPERRNRRQHAGGERADMLMTKAGCCSRSAISGRTP